MLVVDDRENYAIKILHRSEFSVYLAMASACATMSSFLYRQIFALVDGQRNTERIATLLHIYVVPREQNLLCNDMEWHGLIIKQNHQSKITKLVESRYTLVKTISSPFC